MGALTMLNTQGDITIVWEPENDAAMEAIIAEKMAAGCVFYIIEPRLGGLAAPVKTELEPGRFDAARRYRALTIEDKHLAAFVSAGHGVNVKTPGKAAKAVRKAKTAKEVASNESVGVNPRRGG